MTRTFEEIKSAYTLINNNVTVLEMMLQFENILESSGMYAYLNWEEGEVLSGPKIEKYWFTVTLMYDADKMPDPEGGLRLKNLGCEVYFEKSKFRKPVRVLGPRDIQNPLTKKARSEIVDIWEVTIKMPRKLIDMAIQKFVDLSKENFDLDYAEKDDSMGPEGDAVNEF